MRGKIMATALVAAWTVAAIVPASSAEELSLPRQSWSFEGPFGTFDRAAAQRGLQVYEEVCSNCHALSLLAYRNLAGLGYSADQIKAIAAQKEVTDGPNESGDMFERPARPSDHFVSPFANEEAAKAANGGALPPDLSLIVKARAGGPDYIYALLTGFKEEPPAGFTLLEGSYYNEYFPGHQIAMPPPLSEGLVQFADGTPASVDQMAHDVTVFLSWAANPKLEDRKQTGIKVILFLLVLTALLYAYKRRVWAKVH
jgi:ubiquinol-cytochrome c reductase cytochrome c1 subunit